MPSTRYTKQIGFSLVELMVAMVLGLFLTGVVVSIFFSNTRTYATINVASLMQENGRFAVNEVASSLRRAGYLGGNNDVTTVSGGSAGSVTPGTTCNVGDSTWGRMIARRVFGLDDPSSGYGTCIGSGDVANGDVLALRYIGQQPVTSYDANRIYVRTSLFQGRVFKGTNQASTENLVSDTVQSTHSLIANAFYIRNVTADCASGSATVPSLFRMTLDGSGQPTAEELVRGVEDLQVQYGVDDDADGSVNQYFDADNVTNWDLVQSVRFWVLIRAACQEHDLVNDNTYVLGDQTFTPTGDARKFRRQLFSSIVMLRN